MHSLMTVKGLKKEFRTKQGTVVAVNDVSFEIYKGETLGLIGGSGCGKTTLARCLLKLEEPTNGEILIEGENLLNFTQPKLFQFRRQAQMIFQDPFASLNPQMTVREIITEPLKIHQIYSGDKKEIASLLDLVGLSQSSLSRFPHEFSGGQRQRIAIARALALKPQLLICDEPMASLDVSMQAQIANLLKTLQKESNLTYLFISHDMAMVNYLSHRVAVMKMGNIVEMGETKNVYRNPLHPYTRELLLALHSFHRKN